ncbi:putative non-ribosomal peptide synthetase [Serpula lacrymans var. lacrymans S7.9]|uniref:putative non-ribosomal peptide synthetase n=1 Tax=Serpula lacrymans var. lacrymans (strain S7.9) TaxID=578457 RepID=UPI00021D8BCB|nr:putative non-ribosomal peptide synthetase [Serpula lacrymans var. lacrymans S7.9]EGO23306.1 putative non-ribosomal peptide synthetase [Serpula lacrymans var. lacrymans S7.9]
MSPRNSTPAVASMLQKTACNRIFTIPSVHESLISGLDGLGGPALQFQTIPTLAQVFPNLGKEKSHYPFEPYPEAAITPALDAVFLYLHSSGSTGYPKPIPLTNRCQLHWLQQPLPPFHSLGNCMQLYTPLISVITVALYAPTSFHDPTAPPVIPTSENILDNLRKTGANCIIVVPSFLEQWAWDEKAVETLKNMSLVLYGGGPLSSKVGDALCAAGVSLAVQYGTTEFGAPTQLPDKVQLENGLWEWMRFGLSVLIRWVHQGDETYECQLLTTEKYQMAVENMSDVKGYATSDLFVKHPTHEGLWKIIGRTDDVLTLASGEKTVPAMMEGIISSSAHVNGVIMFGRGRNQVGVLVEPRSAHVDLADNKAIEEFRNRIWYEVDEANKNAPTFSRIFKEMILITSPDKPMFRVGKGTTSKNATLKAYEEEIDALTVEASTKIGNSTAPPSEWTVSTLEHWLNEQATELALGTIVVPNIDLFAQGFDSLSATFLRNRIIGAMRSFPDLQLRAAARRIPHNLVFECPNIKLLADRVAKIAGQPQSQVNEQVKGSALHDAKMEIETMLGKYSAELRRTKKTNGSHVESSASTKAGRTVVLLTGSTGGLGSYLLASLLKNEEVAKVYALNRHSKASRVQQRQTAVFEDRELDVALLKLDKLIFIEADATAERCGLNEQTYDQLRQSVTVIIHSAWRVDFNLPLSSFEPNVRGTFQLVDLALSSTLHSTPRFLFISSVGSAQGWDRSRGAFPEDVQLDASVAVGSGYGASKYIAERLVTSSGLNATSLRLGQIAGGPNGAWTLSDWFPILVKSSLALGKFPNIQAYVSWMPAEKVSAAILDVALAKHAPPPALNIVHPHPVSWPDVLKPVRDAVVAKKRLPKESLPFVRMSEWVALLEMRAEEATESDINAIPAIKLLDWFRALAGVDEDLQRTGRTDVEVGGIVKMVTEKAQSISATLSGLSQIGQADAKLWVDYWIARGLF